MRKRIYALVASAVVMGGMALAGPSPVHAGTAPSGCGAQYTGTTFTPTGAQAGGPILTNNGNGTFNLYLNAQVGQQNVDGTWTAMAPCTRADSHPPVEYDFAYPQAVVPDPTNQNGGFDVSGWIDNTSPVLSPATDSVIWNVTLTAAQVYADASPNLSCPVTYETGAKGSITWRNTTLDSAPKGFSYGVVSESCGGSGGTFFW